MVPRCGRAPYNRGAGPWVPARSVRFLGGLHLPAFAYTGAAMAKAPVSSVAFRTIVAIAAIFIIVAGMQAAEDVVLPTLLAVLLSIISAPVVLWLERRRVPAWIAVLVVVIAVMAILAVFGTVLAASVGDFSRAVPHYKARLSGIIGSVDAWIANAGIDASLDRLTRIEPGAAMDTIGATLNGLLSALTNTALVVLTMVFILLEVAEMPRKLRAALNDPARALGRARRMVIEVQRYLVIKTMISALTGVIVGGWTAILGVDFPLLWGTLGFLLNFIPNVGSILAAIPPMLVALIQIGPGHMVLVAVGYVVVNMLLGNILEPQWMGRKLGLSPLVVFLSLLFWGWLWGSVGMLLSVPLTMVFKISFEQSEDLKWIAILLSAAPDVEDQRVRAERSSTNLPRGAARGGASSGESMATATAAPVDEISD